MKRRRVPITIEAMPLVTRLFARALAVVVGFDAVDLAIGAPCADGKTARSSSASYVRPRTAVCRVAYVAAAVTEIAAL
jgi:hypothetical protein